MTVIETNDIYLEIRKDWENFYQAWFEIEIDFSEVVIPEKPTGNYRLLFIAKGSTLKPFYWRKFTFGLNGDDPTLMNKRNTIKSYAIWVPVEGRPDSEFIEKTTDQVDPNMEIGITLLERLIFEAKYFTETSGYLSTQGLTLCSGSRYPDGKVPRVYMNIARTEIDIAWCYSYDSFKHGGIMKVFS
jgi:hypothetical protein